jgi:hypothetical protein
METPPPATKPRFTAFCKTNKLLSSTHVVDVVTDAGMATDASLMWVQLCGWWVVGGGGGGGGAVSMDEKVFSFLVMIWIVVASTRAIRPLA